MAFVTAIERKIPRDMLDLYGRTRAQGFGPEVKRRIILGTYVLSSGYYDAYYLRAQKVRELIRRDFANVFEHVDALISPTSPVAAFKFGERVADPLQMYLADIFTIAANLAGICGISVPCGFAEMDGRRLPIGLQLLGKPLDETRILQVAHAYERSSTDWHTAPPANPADSAEDAKASAGLAGQIKLFLRRMRLLAHRIDIHLSLLQRFHSAESAQPKIATFAHEHRR